MKVFAFYTCRAPLGKVARIALLSVAPGFIAPRLARPFWWFRWNWWLWWSPCGWYAGGRWWHVHSHRWRWPRLWTNNKMLSTFQIYLFNTQAHEHTPTCVCGGFLHMSMLSLSRRVYFTESVPLCVCLGWGCVRIIKLNTELPSLGQKAFISHVYCTRGDLHSAWWVFRSFFLFCLKVKHPVCFSYVPCILREPGWTTIVGPNAHNNFTIWWFRCTWFNSKWVHIKDFIFMNI